VPEDEKRSRNEGLGSVKTPLKNRYPDGIIALLRCLFLRTVWTDIPVSPFCTETPPGNIRNVRRLDGRTLGNSPMNDDFLHKTVKNGHPDVHHFPNDRMDERVDHLAHMTPTIGDLPYITRMLSNLSHLSSRESGRIMRRGVALLSQEGRKEGSLRIILSY